MFFPILKIGFLSGFAFVASLYLTGFGLGGIGQVPQLFPAFANFGGSGFTWPAWNGADAMSNLMSLSSSLTQRIVGLSYSLNLNLGPNQIAGIAAATLIGFGLGKARRHA